MTIRLDENDIRIARHVAFDRGYASVIANLQNRNGGKDDPFLRHVIGALGEVAFAKYLNVYWDGSVGRFKGMGADVGMYQVRTRRGKLPLIIRPQDSDTDLFVLVCMGNTPKEWEVMGYIQGKEGKQLGKLTPMQGGDRYLVDIGKLKNIEGLKP